ncbi:adhesion G protein-coupled receptor E5-like isoform X2 [Myxocyprinus asiaticus]|uniref:adhesion G protein-coupled receptor E5-like isoform X2 n=1 Tax=Myxocyprinus asiaticus TaxID=70543 RepID=UPI0022214466|nr:adhesion G protein-coupled receptor E5-like isoform X2 [Myxocyprinus asiaticus]
MRYAYLLILVIVFALMEKVLMEDLCSAGQYKSKSKCKDENECEYEDPICGDNAKCINTDGSYYCICEKGFEPATQFTQDTGIKCKDINECMGNRIDCGLNAACTNTEGGYACICVDGYTSTNGKETFTAEQEVQCTDRNECEDPSLCGENALCQNTPGGFNCICAAGFRLKSGQTHFTEHGQDEKCQSLCIIDKSICGGGLCQIGKDGHECMCNSGFTNYGDKKIKCTELKCDTFMSKSETSQASPELSEIVSLMSNSCLVLSANESARKEPFRQLDGERLLEKLLDALDNLLHDGFQADNYLVSMIFGIEENALKLIGPFLKNSQTKRSSKKTEVELLVKRGSSPPEGPLMISTNTTQFASHWDTATGNTFLGFAIAALLSHKSLEKSIDSFYGHLEGSENKHFKMNSKVVTAIVSNSETGHLEKPVILTFSHLKPTHEDHICVFWDPLLKGGAWSTRGCTTMSSSDVQTVCSCNHLSSFAVLMALYDIGDVYELRLITWVGLSLSLVCLLMCIATFYFVRSIQSTRNTIHLHLCISLFIACFVFLVGISRTDNKVGCSIVAGVLHYFFLAAFCWMCLEGVQLFRMVVLVFNTTLRPIYMIASGYGVPAVIVAVSAAVNANGYGTERYCWLNFEDGLIWSFYGPVCVIIIVNVFFFLITIWKLAEKFSSLNPDLHNLQKIKSFTVTAIAQMCVLGIMWIFGCFQFNKGTLAMSYIFTILISLQGVLMFIMHCWLSKQVREEYAKFLSCICAPQKRKYSEFSSNQTSKSQASKSVQHTAGSHI